jgi:hypothetical protein
LFLTITLFLFPMTDGNNWTGPIPTQIGSLASLEQLYWGT